jgi:hypothetical protein
MQIVPSRSSSERGAVIIQVAVCLLVLLAFSAFVVDYGIMWASRGQIQTSADSGALAGAIALGYDGLTDVNLAAAKADAQVKARAYAQANGVWGAAPNVQLTDVTFPACPPGAPGPPDTCIKVDAFRNQARGNPLGMLFGNLVGVSSQGVRATATAQVIGASITECLKPWAVMDRWDEMGPIQYAPTKDWNPANDPEFQPPGNPNVMSTETFDRYSDGKGNKPAAELDTYVSPDPNQVGTGYNLKYDTGRRFAVKTDSNTNSTVSAGWFRAIRIPRVDCDGGAGGSCYEENIGSCGGLPNGYADPATVCPSNIGIEDAAYWATKGCYGVETGEKVGPTRQGIEMLLARDSGAYWDSGQVKGSVMGDANWWKSPRVVPVGVIDINHFLSQDPNGQNGVLKMVNIFGFFIEGMGDIDTTDGSMSLNPAGKAVIGRILTIPGLGASKNASNSVFMRSIILVR